MSDSEYEAKEYMDSHHYCYEDHRGSFENGMASQAQTRNLLDGLLEIDRCATTIIGSHDAADYSVAVEQAQRIGMIVTQITHIAEKATLTELPKMKAVDLTGIERECCGTFHGTPHRSTCKNFNTKTRKRDPFYEDGGSGHDLAI